MFSKKEIIDPSIIRQNSLPNNIIREIVKILYHLNLLEGKMKL